MPKCTFGPFFASLGSGVSFCLVQGRAPLRSQLNFLFAQVGGHPQYGWEFPEANPEKDQKLPRTVRAFFCSRAARHISALPHRTKNTTGYSELLRRTVFTTPPHIYYAVNPTLRGKIHAKPRKIVSAQRGSR